LAANNYFDAAFGGDDFGVEATPAGFTAGGDDALADAVIGCGVGGVADGASVCVAIAG
jgi:hypothetical protein